MCGLVGFTCPSANGHAVIETMLESILHRGPDQQGIYCDDNIALGHNRLSIIDLHGGNQPRNNGHHSLVYNGEIYGYQRLGRELLDQGINLTDESDTEVLFALLCTRGILSTLKKIDGMFAFAFVESGRTVYLVRDRCGEKPLYYSIKNKRLFFASELKALRCHPDLSCVPINRHSISSYLTLDYVPLGETLYDGIKSLSPGQVLAFDIESGSVNVQYYWEPRWESNEANIAKFEDRITRLDQLLNDSVTERLIADVDVGVFLSGGVDSSLMTAIAAQKNPAIRAFTIKFQDSEGFDESEYARRLSSSLNLRHEQLELGTGDVLRAIDNLESRLDIPLADSSLIPTFLVCEFARDSGKVVLGGDGADELFAGYPNFKLCRLLPFFRMIPDGVGRWVRNMMSLLPVSDGYMNFTFLLQQLSYGFGKAADSQTYHWMSAFSADEQTQLWKEGVNERNLFQVDDLTRHLLLDHGVRGSLQRMQALFFKTYLVDDILTKIDRASMYNSLEVRSPFLARPVIEFALSLPSQDKLRGNTSKRILKSVALDYLPRELVFRKKHGFALPLARYIRTILKERIADRLLSPRNPIYEFLDQDCVSGILSSHLKGRKNNHKKIWSLYILSIVLASQGRSHRD